MPARSRGSSSSPTPRSGSTPARRWARRCARCSTPSASAGSGSSRTTASTSRERAELPLVGGDVNVGEHVVVRVGDTVRRQVGPHTPAVHALLRHFEQVGFEGAPRVVGIDERGREILLVRRGRGGARAGAARTTRRSGELGRLLRAMHDAQAGFVHAEHRGWQLDGRAPPESARSSCHNDLFWPNVVFRDGHAGRTDRLGSRRSGSPAHDRRLCRELLGAACRPTISSARPGGSPRRGDVNGCSRSVTDTASTREQRASCSEAMEHKTKIGLETHRPWGRDEPRPGWTRDVGSRSGSLSRAARPPWFAATSR